MDVSDDPRFPYPRYLTVPFIFVPDGAPAPPELAQFKRDHPGWVTFRATLAPNASFGERGLPGPGDEFDLRVTGYDQPIGRVVVRGLGQGREPEDQPIQNFTPLPPPKAEPPPTAPVIEVSDLVVPRTTIHVRRRRKPDAAPGKALDVSTGMSRAEIPNAAEVMPVAATTATGASPFLSEVVEWLGRAVSAPLAAVGAAAAVLFTPTAANPGEEEALRQYLAAHGGASGSHGFEPPPPSPPLPGLVPPSVLTTKPGEGGFTPAPPGKPVPGFTPAPPPVLVHPGRPAVENKPVVVESGLPPARATRRGVRRFNPDYLPHVNAAVTETQLAIWVQSQPDQQVVKWGDPIGAHGGDVISMDVKTGEVTLWDAKYRGDSTRIQASKTFEAGTSRRANAIDDAAEAIENTDLLAPAIRDKALANLDAKRLNTRTVGFGGVKNSVIGN